MDTRFRRQWSPEVIRGCASRQSQEAAFVRQGLQAGIGQARTAICGPQGSSIHTPAFSDSPREESALQSHGQQLADAVDRFFVLIEDAKDGGPVDLREFELLLVQLTLNTTAVIHEREITTWSSWPDTGAPSLDVLRFQEAASAAFPNFGYYRQVHPITTDIGGPDPQLVLADAFDDVIDIASDLAGFRWLWSQGRREEALHDIRESYESHWALHAIGLLTYLWALRNERRSA
ncbi:MAG: hypothetical protein AB8G96_12435 [Phycisphaerales bacterium]